MLVGTAVLMCLVASAVPASAVVETEKIVDGANFPTNLAVAPDGRIFYTEKDTGQVRVVEDDQLLEEPFATFAITEKPETGLLGIALDPAFPREPWVYVLYSDVQTGHNELVRLRAEGNTGVDQESVLQLLSTEAGYHNGGDLAFGADGKLYVTVGEAHLPELAQDEDELHGKILRLNPDGSIPEDNPFGGDNPAYTLGHRNSFGICVDGGTDEIWETENGPSENDEVNRITAGSNYGWPKVSGPSDEEEFVSPVLNYPEIIVPTGCAAFNSKVLFGDFAGRLHAFDANNPVDTIADTLPAGITDVHATKDGVLYVSTQDAIYRVKDLEVTLSEPDSPEPSASAAAGSSGEGSTSTVAWITGGVALILVLAGGFALRRLQVRGHR